MFALHAYLLQLDWNVLIQLILYSISGLGTSWLKLGYETTGAERPDTPPIS